MNICMMTNTYRPHVGGVAHSVANLAGNLRERGHRVLIVAPTFGQKHRPGEAWREAGEPDLIRVSAIQNFNGSDFSVRLPVPFQLDTALSHFDPDLIHSHHPFLLGDTALRVARHFKVPLVFTHHTLYERYTHYVPLNSSTLQNFVIQLSTEYANLCEAVIAPSESVASLIARRGVTSTIEAIPSGVDMEFFSRGSAGVFRQQHDIAPGKRIIGHVGRLAREKNLEWLTRAVTPVLQEHPELLFVITGEGPARVEMERHLVQHGVRTQVLFTGSLSGSSLADVYQAMELFVFSSFSETQGMVIAEAMASGVPVLALDASGVREVVSDGYNGRLLNADTDEEHFAATLSEMLSLPALRQYYAAGVRETAARLSRERITDEVTAFYRRALEKYSLTGHGEHHPEVGLFSGKLQAEWELVSQKATAVFRTLRSGSSKDQMTDPTNPETRPRP